MYLVDSKSSEFVVKKVSGCIFFSCCNIKIVWLHHVGRRNTFTYHWLFQVELVTHSDSQISEDLPLNPSFTMFSGRISDRVLILKECSFVLAMFKEFRSSENTDKLLCVQYFSLYRPDLTKT